MRKNKINILLLFLISSLIFSGCASKANFTNTPVKQIEFTKNIETLKQDYSDINKYNASFVLPQNTPKVEELEKMWGEPEKTKQWFEFGFFTGVVILMSAFGTPAFLAVYLFQPMPRENYVWKKGDYTISAEGANSIYVGYEKRMFQWEWKNEDEK